MVALAKKRAREDEKNHEKEQLMMCAKNHRVKVRYNEATAKQLHTISTTRDHNLRFINSRPRHPSNQDRSHRHRIRDLDT